MKKINSSVALIIGIAAGFAFLLVFFVGIGLSNNQVVVIGLFFITILSTITLLLFNQRKARIK